MNIIYYCATKEKHIMQLKMESDELQELIKARLQFNKLLLESPIGKDAQGNRGSYLSLEALQEATIQLMNQVGLFIEQTTLCDNGKEYLVSTLRHSSGQYTRSIGYLYKEEDAMDCEFAKLCGAMMTYKQRYQWRSILNVGRGSEDVENEPSHSNTVTKQQSFELYNLMKDRKDIMSLVFKRYDIKHCDNIPKDKYEEVKTIITTALNVRG
jgi:hypothetical protein